MMATEKSAAKKKTGKKTVARKKAVAVKKKVARKNIPRKTVVKKKVAKKTVARKNVARKAVVKKKAAKKATTRATRRKAAAAPPRRGAVAAPRSALSHLAVALHSAAVTTLRGQVVDIVASATGHSTSDVDGPPLSNWICDQALQADIAAKINGEWPDLDPPFTSADVKCSDTIDVLASRVKDHF